MRALFLQIALCLLLLSMQQVLAAVGGSCVVNTDCTGTGEVCDTSDSLGGGVVCTCDSGYHDTDADNACNACGQGTFKASMGTGACSNAQAGYYASIGGTAATSAATGETQVTGGSYACITGDTSGTGLSSAAYATCPCPTGKYSSGNGNTVVQEVQEGLLM